MKGSYLGPGYSDKEVESELKKCRAVYKKLKPDEILKETAKNIV